MVLCVPMRSALFRMTIGAIAWVALGGAAYILFQSEQRIDELAASLQQFDLRARQATSALGEARVAQQAYVAAGQGITGYNGVISNGLFRVNADGTLDNTFVSGFAADQRQHAGIDRG